MTAAIEISGLVKSFGRQRALDGLDLRVESGEVHAFLGPNGAGKSTTIRVLLGLLRADSGVCQLLGDNPWRDAVGLHRRLAYVPGEVSLWPNLSGGETIDVLQRMHGSVDRSRRDELIDRFNLDPRKKCRSYSKGNRQKVALIAALALDVELYVFDEPTSGLDPLMERMFQECVTELRASGRTVLLSSHILGQVDKLSDSVTIIRDGRVVQSGRLEALRHLHRVRMTARIGVQAKHADASGLAIAGLKHVPGVHDLKASNEVISFSLDREHTSEVLRALADLGVAEITAAQPSLEDLFLSEYSVAG